MLDSYFWGCISEQSAGRNVQELREALGGLETEALSVREQGAAKIIWHMKNNNS
jgi:hypothetical protein